MLVTLCSRRQLVSKPVRKMPQIHANMTLDTHIVIFFDTYMSITSRPEALKNFQCTIRELREKMTKKILINDQMKK